MKLDFIDISALSIAAFMGLVAPSHVIFSDIGLRNAVEDGSALRTRFYLALGANPERYNIPQKAIDHGNCRIMGILDRAGADLSAGGSGEASPYENMCP